MANNAGAIGHEAILFRLHEVAGLPVNALGVYCDVSVVDDERDVRSSHRPPAFAAVAAVAESLSRRDKLLQGAQVRLSTHINRVVM